MSTTKDKSQVPYTMVPMHAATYGPDTYTIDGPTEVMGVRRGQEAKIHMDALNAAYSAGQADRDELVKALKEARLLLPSAINEETSIEWDNRVANSLLNIDMVLSRYPNP